MAAALALAVAAIGVAALVDALRDGDPAEPDSAAAQLQETPPEPRALELDGSVAVERPAGLALVDGSIWVSSASAGTIVRVDPERATAVATIDVEGRPGLLAGSGRRVYAFDRASGDAVVVDASSNLVGRRLPGFSAVIGAVFVAGDAWVPDPAGWTVARVDPRDGSVRARISSPSPTAIAGDESGIWVVSSGEHTVTRIDPASNLVVAILPFEDAPGDVALGAGAVWVSHPGAGAVSRLDPATNEVVARVELGDGLEPLFLAADAVSVWVLGVSRLARIDPATNQMVAAAPFVATRQPGPEPLVLGGLVASGSTAWVADTYGDRVVRFNDPAALGG
jgi:streptogramin lyase